MADAQKEYVFRDPTRLTRVVLWSLYALIALEVASLAFDVLELRLLRTLAAHSFTDSAAITAEATASDLHQRVIGGVGLLIYLVVGTSVLMWFYRTNANVRARGVEGMQITPTWAVAWNFIPIASLFKPYQAVKEIWQASSGEKDWKLLDRPAVMPWWWGFWVLSNVLDQVSFRLSMRGDDVDTLIAANIAGMAGSVTDVVACLLLIPIVRQVYAMQTRTPAT